MITYIENCDLCGSRVADNSIVLAKAQFDQYGVKSNIHIVMCKRCKYIFQHEKFDYETLQFLYKQDNGFDPSPDLKRTEVYLRNKKRRQQAITSAIELADLFHKKRLNVLDVGGGIGEITEHLCGRCKVYLADVNNSMPINSKIVKINKLFDEIEFTKKFHVIVMNHVLEHVFSPTNFLKKAHSILTDQGIVIIEVPFELYTSILFKRVGDWRHVAYFSTNILGNFLRKTEFDPLSLKLCTSYYDRRRLTVIRAIARRVVGGSSSCDYNSNYFALLRDGLNIRALTHYFLTQLHKLLR